MNMSKPFKLVNGVLGLALATLGIVALSAQIDHRAFDDSAQTKEALTWMKGSAQGPDHRRLDKEDWRAVIEQKEKAAEAMVNAKSWVALDDAQAKSLTGGYSQASDKTKPYLLRGLSSSSRAGGTSLYVNPKHEVSVSGGVLSHFPVRLRKQCLVAWLEFAPNEVWISYSVAE